jgi:hypothetical protein
MNEISFIEDKDQVCALAPVAYAPIRHHVLVCSGKSCMKVGSEEVKEAFERELKARGLLFGKAKKGKNPQGSVVLTECASVGFCAGAPVRRCRDRRGTSRRRARRRTPRAPETPRRESRGRLA